ncbi:MAG: hypothetical protein GY866_17670 [Proteobacteria bacterium]|nr:hypothetical protein [Pseudomonadota bacterium]
MSDPNAHLNLSSCIGLSVAFLVLFMRRMLDSRRNMPKIDRLMSILAVLLFVWAGLNVIDKYFYQFIVVLGMPFTLTLFGIGLYSLYRRIPLANFLVFGMGWYIIGLFLIAAVNFGAVPYKFFSIIAHDLRGPIGSLAVLFNDIAEEGADIDAGLFAHIGASTKQTHQLLENLLTWARSQRGDLEFNPINRTERNRTGLLLQ